MEFQVTGKNDKGQYLTEPLESRDQIPVFSKENKYTQNYELISRQHLNALAETGQNPWIADELWVQMEESTLTLIEEYAAPGCRILDVGVGTGRLLEKVPELDRYGLDISFPYLQVAKSKGIDVCYSLVEDMPYKKDYFDIVVCTDVLEHVLDLNHAVSQILSVVKDDGILVVRVPYRENMSGYTSPDCEFEYVHLRDFNEHTLALLFAKVFSCTIETTQLCGYHYFDEHRLREPFGEYLKTDQWIDNLRRIAPDLFWDFLHRFGVPQELCAVIRKPKSASLKPVGRPVHGDQLSPAWSSVEKLRQQCNTLRQKYAFITSHAFGGGRLSAASNEGIVAQSKQLIASNDSLNIETAQLKQAIENREQEIKGIVAQSKQLIASNDSLNIETAQLKQAIENREQEIKGNVAQSKQLIASNDSLNIEAAQLKQIIEKLTSRNQELGGEAQQLNKNNQKLAADKNRLFADVAQLKQTSEQLTASNEHLNTEIGELRSRCSLLTETNEDLTSRCRNLSSQVELLRKRICIDPRALWRTIRPGSQDKKEFTEGE